MTAQVLVLAHAADLGAMAVAARLAGRLGRAGVRVVRPEILSLARWSHRVDSRGRASTRIALPNAEPLVSEDLGAVFNRIRYLSLPRFRRASAKDRDYAGAELHAVVASWLAGLGGRVVHSVRQHPWVTPSLARQQWASVAARCGLPVAVRRIESAPPARPPGMESERVLDGGDRLSATVLVAAGVAGGRLASRFGQRCVAAARGIGLPLLEFRFAVEKREPVLVDVDPLPPLVEPWVADMVSGLLESLASEGSS